MASTVTAVVAKFKDRCYPDCPDATAQSLFTDAWTWGVQKFRLREETVTLSLTEGTREYDLDSDVTAIREAYYQVSADPTTWRVMNGVSIDRLARTESSWRANTTESESWRYYTRADSDGDSGKKVIGLDPLPIETTSAGYPNVTLYTIMRSDLSGSEEMPAFLPTDDWFIYEMAFRFAVVKDAPRAGYWDEVRKREEALVVTTLKGDVDEVPTMEFLSPFANGLTRVI